MARAPVGESLVARRYRHDLAEYAAWQQHQARLRRLVGRALDALEETLDAGGPDALKAAALILRTTATMQEPRPPSLLELATVDDDDLLAAGLTRPTERVNSAP
ncbi:MAG: hypothetical protein WDA03_06415 [Trueperaceae bacterium]